MKHAWVSQGLTLQNGPAFPQAARTHEGFRGIQGLYEPMSLLGGGPHFPKHLFQKQEGRWNLGLA